MADVVLINEPVTATMAATLAAIRKCLPPEATPCRAPIVEFDRDCSVPHITPPLKAILNSPADFFALRVPMSGESNTNDCMNPIPPQPSLTARFLIVREFSEAPQLIARNTVTESTLLELEYV